MMVRWILHVNDRGCLSSTSSRAGEGEMVQERDVKQGRGRPRKQYLVQWKQSWVDSARLAAPELLQSWREKKASKSTH